MDEKKNSSDAGRERTLESNIKLYYDLALPSETEAHSSVTAAPASRPLLIALHGYGSNKNWMMREAKMFAPSGFAIAALQGFHQHMKEPKEPGGAFRYGFGWLTNFHPEDSVALHHDALLKLTGALVDEGLVDPARIFLLGFSQSCALNYRFAFTHPKILRGVVGICGGLPGDWTTNELYQPTEAAVLHLHGTRDQFYTPARVAGYAAQLQMRAHDVEMKSYEAGHELAPAMRADLKDWLEARARLESA